MPLEWWGPVRHGPHLDPAARTRASRPRQDGALIDKSSETLSRRSRNRDAQDTGAAGAEESETGARKRVSLRPLLALKPCLLRHPGKLALAGSALLISAVAMLAIPLAVRRVIDLGFASQDGVFVDRYFAMLVVIGLVLALASAARFYYVNWLGERVVADVRSDVFRHIAGLGPAFFERTHSGEVMSRLTADTTQIKAVAGASMSQALRSAIMLAGALVMMIVTSPGPVSYTPLTLPTISTA